MWILNNGDFEHGDFEHGDFEHGDFEHGDFEYGDFEVHSCMTLCTLHTSNHTKSEVASHISFKVCFILYLRAHYVPS